MVEKKQLFCRTCEQHNVKVEIKFDRNVTSSSGKMIPIEVGSGNKHQCPFRQAGPQQVLTPQNNSPEAVGARTSDLEASINVIKREIESKLLAINDRTIRIEQTLAALVMNTQSKAEAPATA
jgi:hypothetical protein